VLALLFVKLIGVALNSTGFYGSLDLKAHPPFAGVGEEELLVVVEPPPSFKPFEKLLV